MPVVPSGKFISIRKSKAQQFKTAIFVNENGNGFDLSVNIHQKKARKILVEKAASTK